ncbi:hypothetical protein [Bosea caraganae]|uniref:hypothetical protein n=1 Tax=Bosea caraganae TaxID=2763117 RepID=UPI0011C0669D|nr:hypothetical protein [Bosea caraganae]
MLRSACWTVQAAALTIALSAGAMAQTLPPAGQASPGTGPTTTHPSQIDKGQNSILPSAGRSGPSAAPTMVYDCQAKPEDCTVPATPGDKAGASRTNPIKP